MARMVQWRGGLSDADSTGRSSNEWNARKRDFLMRYDRTQLRKLAEDEPERASAISEMIAEALTTPKSTGQAPD